MATYRIVPCEFLSDKFNELWQQFATTLKNRKTKYEYMLAVNKICSYFEADFVNITLLQASDYFKHLAKSGLGIKTLHARLSVYRSVSQFIADSELIEDYSNPFLHVHVEDYSEYVQPASIPTLAELDLLLQHVESDHMLYLIFALVLRCSLSVAEICRLKAEMFRMDGMDRMFVTFETGKSVRKIKIPDDVVNILIDYCNEMSITSGPLFYNKKGKVLSYHALSDRVRDAMKEVNMSYTLQDLRNTSIAHMLHGGAATKEVADYAGVSERWMYRFREVIEELDVAPCDYQHFLIKGRQTE